jgi:FtsP/CotA-like multicopper oxidase with cupredoxin domain
VPGPTLVVRPGDHLRVRLTNRLPGQPTNLHLHGLHVSPRGHGDNVFVSVPSRHGFTYDYDIPVNHTPGAYWYHAHRQMFAARQVASGMVGNLIVEGGVDDMPAIRAMKTRTMAFEEMQITPEGDAVSDDATASPPYITYVNGQLRPRIDIRPGEYQRWRLANMQTDAFLSVPVPAGLTAWLIETDGTPTARPTPIRVIDLSPGGRRSIIVRAGAPRDVDWSSAPGGPKYDVQELATVHIGGLPMSGQALPGALSTQPDLRQEPIARRRTVVFAVVNPGPDETYSINGKNYDDWGRRNLATMKLNTTEEWTLLNTSPYPHPFHIHIQPFQVMSVNGVPQRGVRYLDTVKVPSQVNGVPGKVVIRQRYRDFTGRFVIHCHIIWHEDHGMMAPVQVVR